MARFQKGTPKPKSGGRKKGTPNKVTIAAKLAMLEAFAEVGGVAALVAWAKSKKPKHGLTEFFKLWSKTLPREISGPDGGPIPFENLTTDDLRAELQRLREARTALANRIGEAGGGGPVPGVVGGVLPPSVEARPEPGPAA